MSGHGRPAADTVDAAGLRLALVASCWHPQVADLLLERAQAAAAACGVSDTLVTRVAGVWELPVTVQAVAGGADAVVALGCVLRGRTDHYRHLSRTVYDGLSRVALDTRTPVGNGVLTCAAAELAAARAGGPEAEADAGWEATLAALQATLAARHAGWGRCRPLRSLA